MQTVFTEVRATKDYLVIKFTLRGALIPHKYTVRVPWRRLNDLYREVIEGMEHEALRELRKRNASQVLPLEKWE